LVPEPSALKLFGEFGLYLMCALHRSRWPLRALLMQRNAFCACRVIEVRRARSAACRVRVLTPPRGPAQAGFEIEIRTLKQVGTRALGASVVGMLMGAGPLAFGVAKALGLATNEALAVGASLAPCSTGVALVVLKRKKALNTPIGQLIIATAFAEDIIALILLSELRALSNPTVISLIRPVGVSLAYAIAFGAAAIFVIPYALSRFIIPLVPAHLVELALLLLLFAMAGGLMAGLSAGGASPLLGAFLAGLSFCTIRSIEHVWKSQVKRLQTWLVRIFFACTVGFDVPVRRFGSALVWRRAAVFWCATLGKLLAGIFGVPRKAPQMMTLGLAMASLGEFSFIVGATARNELKLMSDDTYASVTLAVLMTIVISPTALGYVQDWAQRRAESDLKRAAVEAKSPAGRIYYKLDIKVLNRWGLVADILRLLSERDVEVIEFRVDLRGDFALYEAYLKDNKLCAPRPGDVAFPELNVRLLELRTGLMVVLSHDTRASVAGGSDDVNVDGEVEDSIQTINFAALRGLRLERWMPGIGPEEWDEAGLVGNEEQATVIMRREVERSAGQRSVMDIFGRALLPHAEEKESDLEDGDAAEGAGDEATPVTPADVTRRTGIEATAVQRRSSGDGGSRRMPGDDDGTSPRGSLDGGPRHASLDTPTSSLQRQPSLQRRMSLNNTGSLAAAMAAMAAHMAQQPASPEQQDYDTAVTFESDLPPTGLGDSALAEAESVDRAINAARARLSVAKLADDDAHGLLGIVRHHRPRGLNTPGYGSVSQSQMMVVPPPEMDAGGEPEYAHDVHEGEQAAGGEAGVEMTPADRGVRWSDEV
jgi:Kef-type K+ transport system membrane component KefB